MAAKDYYRVLGVSRDADDAELKKAYRNLSRAHHPDRNAGNKEAEERFKEISEAYAVLSDAEKRAHYDRFGTAPGAGAGPDMGFATIFEDLVEGFFGGSGGGRRGRGRRGDDLRYALQSSPEGAAGGGGTQLQNPPPRTLQGRRPP